MIFEYEEQTTGHVIYDIDDKEEKKGKDIILRIEEEQSKI
jgi:hypothetical protein